MKTIKVILGVLVVAIVILAGTATYIVSEDEVAVVKTFGKTGKVITNPQDIESVKSNLKAVNRQGIQVVGDKGLHFKIPFAQTVYKYDSKYLTYVSKKETINTLDKSRLDIQMYAQYRIVDPAKYNWALRTESMTNSKLDQELYPVVIQSVNKVNFDEFFQQGVLEKLINDKLDVVNKKFISSYGIYVSDVGINRKTFPASNTASIESKMSKQIEKESEKLNAEGDSAYQKAKATTDRQRKEILAGAIEEAAITKAAADAESLKIYQESLKKDLEFYKFIQRMNIYKELNNTTIFLDKDNDLLEYINGY